MIFPSVLRLVHHEYCDNLTNTSKAIPCYSIEEVFPEELRSLIQWSYTAPRDFYDIWYLSKNVSNLKWPDIVKAFHEKMVYKGLKYTGIEQMINIENEKRLLGAWENSLGHQVPGKLPEYPVVKRQFENY